MKILYIDVSTEGHHLNYLKYICTSNNSIVILPSYIDDLSYKQYIFNTSKKQLLSFANYVKLFNFIFKIAVKENVDTIHFLYGDFLYRYFGYCISILREYNLIVTFHHIRRSFLHDISLRRIFQRISIGIVHTKNNYLDLKNIGIENIEQIEYPNFSQIHYIDKSVSRKLLKLPQNTPVILFIGATRYDKGLDILLDALVGVEDNFHLLIAGKEDSVNHELIAEKTKQYKDKVTIILKYLSEDEYATCVNTADIMIFPYRRIFDGASGPLTDGVWLKKKIIGPNHGSLGELINYHEIGLTFESENILDLRDKIIKVLYRPNLWNNKAELYRKSLHPNFFVEKYQMIYKRLVE